MIELKDIYYLDSQGSQAKGLEGFEEICAYQQGFNFTEEPGVYEKDGKKYVFDASIELFVEKTQDTAEENNPTVVNDNGNTYTTTITHNGDGILKKSLQKCTGRK